MSSLLEIQLKALDAMKVATQRGIIDWRQSEVDRDCYYTDRGPLQSYIHFKYPSYNGDVGSDRDFVDVGGVGRFMIGTTGWVLALEILAEGDETWANHLAVLQEQMVRQLRLIENAIAADIESTSSQSDSMKTNNPMDRSGGSAAS